MPVPSQTCFGVASSVAQPSDGSEGSVAVTVLGEVKSCPGLLAELSNSNLPKTGMEIPKFHRKGTEGLKSEHGAPGMGKG